jgi:hypothetical protein
MADCLMTDLIRQFWARCEETQPVFSADELRWATPGKAEAIRVCGLLAEGAKATWANCDACDDGRVEDVVWIRNTETGCLSPFIPCPEVGGAPVDPERLRRWAVNLDLAARLMRQALGLVGQFAPLVPGRVWSLGRRHLAGRFRVFFCAARPGRMPVCCGNAAGISRTPWLQSCWSPRGRQPATSGARK